LLDRARLEVLHHPSSGGVIPRLLFADHHIFDLQLLSRLPGDDSDDLDTGEGFYYNLRIDGAVLNSLDGTWQLISGTDSH
jgi:hypothetical protein